MPNAKEMLEIVGRYGAAKNRHDIDAALEDCPEDFFIEIVPFLNRIEGKEKVRVHLQRLGEAFPDNVAVREAVAVGDDVVISLWHLRGTMRAPFLGMEPTGKEIDVPMFSVFPFKDGTLAGERVFYDVATFCRQAGLPIPQAALTGVKATAPAKGLRGGEKYPSAEDLNGFLRCRNDDSRGSGFLGACAGRPYHRTHTGNGKHGAVWLECSALRIHRHPKSLH